jgi:hypothetical protein
MDSSTTRQIQNRRRKEESVSSNECVIIGACGTLLTVRPRNISRTKLLELRGSERLLRCHHVMPCRQLQAD